MPISILHESDKKIYLLYTDKFPFLVKEEHKRSISLVLSLELMELRRLKPKSPPESSQRVCPSVKIPSKSNTFVNPPVTLQSIPEEIKEVPAKEKQEMKKELLNYLQPMPKKYTDKNVSKVLTSVIISMCGLRLKLLNELTKDNDKADIKKVLESSNDVLAINYRKLSTLNIQSENEMIKRIEEIISKGESLINQRKNPFKLKCGHKVTKERFIKHAKELKNKMKTGPLQYKCPRSCFYILNDKEIVTLSGKDFDFLIKNYNVITSVNIATQFL